jgi:tetratricopeptide (TPR) repeat protein
MKKTRNKKNSFILGGALLIGGLAVLGIIILSRMQNTNNSKVYVYPDSKFGNYLAIKHAIWVDDFDSVIKFSGALKDSDVASVKADVAVSQFLAGNFDYSAKALAGESALPARIARAAYLLRTDDWKGVYSSFAKDNSQILAPVRIWSAVAVGKESEALKFINQTNASESWKLFARGMVYAETKKPAKAKEYFDKVPLDFFNLNDYLYLMAFYEKNGFDKAAGELHKDFSETPGGAFARSYKAEYADFSGFKKALCFGLIQNVSHTPSMSYSGAALMLMRLTQAIGGNNDPINYYLGMYFYISGSEEYVDYFSKINTDSPYYLFVMMKNAERAGNFNKMRSDLKEALKKNPYFIPALQKLVAINLQKGRYDDALDMVNNALKTSDLSREGSEKIKSYLLLMRARVYLADSNLDKAQDDILKAGDLTHSNPEVLLSMAKVWAAKKEHLDKAYLYVTAVIKDSPSNIDGWDTLAMVVWAKEGTSAAAEVLERVGRVANENSALFQHLGDVRAMLGDKNGAIEAYQHALILSGDGLSCSETCLESKIKRLK